MRNRAIQILVIEDSRLYRMYLQRVMEDDPQLAICAMSASAQEARELLGTVHPDVITLDLHLPDDSDFELLRELISKKRAPVLVVSSDPDACRAAIALGAEDFVEKVGSGMSQEQFAMLTRLKIKNLVTPAHIPQSKHRLPATPVLSRQMLDNRVIAIGASLGGTEATLNILRLLPASMPGILVVQHMPEGFTNAYAMRLDKNCALRVREARNFDAVEPGLVLVAPGRHQMRLVKARDGYRVRCVREDDASGFCPSVDVLFSSVAQVAGAQATGVLLTGIGRDGAAGLLEMHKCGAGTFGQRKETCAVYGMPDAARKLGAVDEELAPEEIAKRLIGIAHCPSAVGAVRRKGRQDTKIPN